MAFVSRTQRQPWG